MKKLLLALLIMSGATTSYTAQKGPLDYLNLIKSCVTTINELHKAQSELQDYQYQLLVIRTNIASGKISEKEGLIQMITLSQNMAKTVRHMNHALEMVEDDKLKQSLKNHIENNKRELNDLEQSIKQAQQVLQYA